jgi:pimeloyl-ACP methyl ester carboxylesterase
MSNRLIFLPGLNGDSRIFRNLAMLFPCAEVVKWIAPQRRESITNYAARLAETLGKVDGAIIVGVSFGGILAQELAVSHCANACLIVSSVRGPEELPPHYRMARTVSRLPAESLISGAAATVTLIPKTLRSTSTMRIASLKGKHNAWRRWAIGAVLRWQPRPAGNLKVIQIHGDQDATFPIRHLKPDITIQGGGHLIALTHANEIAKAISDVNN